MSVTNLLTAISILEPLIRELIEYLRGSGSKPKWFSSLPEKALSRIELERQKAL